MKTDETNKVYSPLWHQIYAIVRAGGDYYAIASEIEELLTPIPAEPQSITRKEVEKQIHVILSIVPINNDNLDYIKQLGEVAGKLRWDLVKVMADFALSLSPSPQVTDEEITEKSISYSSGMRDAAGMQVAFCDGAEWMRDLLTNKEAK